MRLLLQELEAAPQLEDRSLHQDSEEMPPEVVEDSPDGSGGMYMVDLSQERLTQEPQNMPQWHLAPSAIGCEVPVLRGHTGMDSMQECILGPVGLPCLT